MKAEELRIGNLLETTNNGIAHVTWGVIKDIESGDRYYKPIPLTEEWLIKFGFKSQSDFFIEKNYYTLKLPKKIFDYDNSLTVCDKNIIFGYYGSIKIEYVHQLQNLFFSLTGEELEIKEK